MALNLNKSSQLHSKTTSLQPNEDIKKKEKKLRLDKCYIVCYQLNYITEYIAYLICILNWIQ